jgi:hypothetical protein
MREPFHFKDNIYVYSVETLIDLYQELCANNKWSAINEAYNNVAYFYFPYKLTFSKNFYCYFELQ